MGAILTFLVGHTSVVRGFTAPHLDLARVDFNHIARVDEDVLSARPNFEHRVRTILGSAWNRNDFWYSDSYRIGEYKVDADNLFTALIGVGHGAQYKVVIKGPVDLVADGGPW